MTTANKLELVLFKKQREFVEDRHAFMAFVGGIGSGKTRGGDIKALLYVSEHPGALGMVTAPTFPMLRDATLKTMFELYPKNIYDFNRTDMTLTFKNGSSILLRSTDDPEHLRGPNLAFFYMDEAARSSFEAFQILQGRLRQEGYPHQGWITTTPKGRNWVFREFSAKQREDYKLLLCSTRENPFLPTEFIPRLEDSYNGRFALQEIEGQFITQEGGYFDDQALAGLVAGCLDPKQLMLGGVLRIWKRPIVANKYIAGGDLAWGETGAYSCLSILDWQTGEVVAELHGRLKADEVAQEVVKLCRQYNDAYLGIENNSEGMTVVQKCVELGYGNRMFYQDYDKRDPQKPGWHTDMTTRPLMLGELEEAVRQVRLRIYCRDAVNELMSFVRDERGHPGPADGSYADHVMSLAIAWQMRKHARFGLARGAHGVRLPFTWGAARTR